MRTDIKLLIYALLLSDHQCSLLDTSFFSFIGYFQSKSWPANWNAWRVFIMIHSVLSDTQVWKRGVTKKKKNKNKKGGCVCFFLNDGHSSSVKLTQNNHQSSERQRRWVSTGFFQMSLIVMLTLEGNCLLKQGQSNGVILMPIRDFSDFVERLS